MESEANVMEYVRAQGYPVPAVEHLSADGLEMLMERIEGTDMVTAITSRPWTVRNQGRALADLHDRLHALAAPDWLHDAPVGKGDRLLHLDLHPLNVMVGPKGPVVIDWANASRGHPAVDVALAWVLLRAGSATASWVINAVLGRFRSLLVNSFMERFDLNVIRACLPEVVSWKISDPHMSSGERARMWKLVEEWGVSPGES